MYEYRSKYTGQEVDLLLDKISNDNVGKIDSSLSETSENPVMNKIITSKINEQSQIITELESETNAKLTELEGKIKGISLADYSNTISSNTFINIEPSTQEREVTISFVSDNPSALTKIVFLKDWSPLLYVQGLNIDYQYNGYKTTIPSECNKIGLYPSSEISLSIQFSQVGILKRVEGLESSASELRTEVGNLEKEVENKFNDSIGIEVFTINNKYINHLGQESNGDTFICTDYIPFIPVDIVFSGLRYNENYVSAIAFYDTNKNFLSAAYDFDDSEQEHHIAETDIPSTAAYIRASSTISLSPKIKLYSFPATVEVVNQLRYPDTGQSSKRGSITSNTQSLASGSSLSMYVPNIKDDKNISFCADVLSFDSLDLRYGNDYAYYRKGAIRIETNDLVVYSPNSVQDDELLRVAHGLNISTFLYVQIKGETNGAATITIASSDGVFVKDLSKGSFYGCVGDIVVTSNGSSLANCILSYGSPALQEETWAYGDSYFDYWTNQAKSTGHGHFLNDGHSGRRTEDALVSFKKELEMHLPPKRVLWCMGMNNFDTEMGINTEYKSATDELITICDKLGVEVILCTIPNCWNYNTGGSSIRHTYKNEYVKNSGKRYVDVAHALGADRGEGIDWYVGLRQTNDIHPSSLGAEILMQYIISQVPEL